MGGYEVNVTNAKVKPWLDVTNHEAITLADYVSRRLLSQAFEQPHRFLSLGVDPAIEALLALPEWSGLSVHPVGTKTAKPSLSHKRIHAYLHQVDHIMPVFGGYWVVPLTMAKLFNQFPGPYGVISINWESMNRQLWEAQSVQDHLPYVYVLPEDGHNEGVLHRCWDRGYTAHHVEDRLVMIKDLVLES